MQREMIAPFAYATEIMEALPRGILLGSQLGNKTNIMTIAWGGLDNLFSLPMFVTFVREHRFTRQCIDSSGHFTICAPLGKSNMKILAYAGAKSGRDVDKIAALNMTPLPGFAVSAPAFIEFPLTLECAVIYRQKLSLPDIPAAIREKMYPQDVDSFHPLANKDTHIAYYGEIVASYILRA